MSERATGLPESFLDPAVGRMERVEDAFRHVATAVHLELADIALDPDALDDAARESLQALGQSLMHIVTISHELLGGIIARSGLEIEGADALSTQLALPTSPHVRRSTSSHRSSSSTREPKLPTEPNQRGRRGKPASAAPGSASRNGEGKESSNELYKAVVDVSRVPQMELNGDGKAAEVKVVEDQKVQIGEHTLPLTGHDLFIFNNSTAIPRAEARGMEYLPAPAGQTSYKLV